MPRAKRLDNPRSIELVLPLSLFERMEIRLLNDDGKVPYGAYSKLYEQLIKEWLNDPVD
jgi:hypothetical protein